MSSDSSWLLGAKSAQPVMPRGTAIRTRRTRPLVFLWAELGVILEGLPSTIPIDVSPDLPTCPQDAVQLMTACRAESQKLSGALAPVLLCLAMTSRSLMDISGNSEEQGKHVKECTQAVLHIKRRLTHRRIWKNCKVPLESPLEDESHHRIPYKQLSRDDTLALMLSREDAASP